jgi:hypothetical protein
MHFDTLGGFVSAQSFDSFGTVFWLPAPFGTWKKQKEVNSAPAHKLTWWLWRRRRWALVRALVDAEGCSQPVMVATRWGPEISCLERNPYHWYPSYVCAFLITSHGRKTAPCISWIDEFPSSYLRSTAIFQSHSGRWPATHPVDPHPNWVLLPLRTGVTRRDDLGHTRPHDPWDHWRLKEFQNGKGTYKKYQTVTNWCGRSAANRNMTQIWGEPKNFDLPIFGSKKRQSTTRKNGPTRYPKCCFHISWHPYK